MLYIIYEIYNSNNEYQGYYLPNEKEMAYNYARRINGYVKEVLKVTTKKR